MPELLQIGIDKPFVMPRGTWYFRYGGLKFKFVQTAARWSDLLLTIVADRDSKARAHAYATGAEWASALSWELRLPIAVRPAGISGLGLGIPLRRLRGNTFIFPSLPFKGDMRGWDFNRVGYITDEHQRTALALLREGSAANSDLLSILLYWQVLEIRATDPVGWVNKAIRKYPSKLHQVARYLRYLNLGPRQLGNYLLDDCRHAIAHIKRRAGSIPLRLDSIDDVHRLKLAAVVLGELARFYTENNLGMTERLYLVRGSRDVAEYVDRRAARTAGYVY